MFIVEKIANDFDSREELYNKKVDKWIAEGERDGYNYRDENGYSRKFGNSPKTKLKSTLKNAGLALAVSVFFALMMTYVTISVVDNNTTQEVKK